MPNVGDAKGPIDRFAGEQDGAPAAGEDGSFIFDAGLLFQQRDDKTDAPIRGAGHQKSAAIATAQRCRCELGLGSIPLVPLAEAREKAIANRKVAREGGDALADRRRVQRTPTFEVAAAKVLEQKRPGWRSPKHGQQWWATLKPHAFLCLSALPVSEITGADVLGTLQPIWHARPDAARRVRQRIHAVLE